METQKRKRATLGFGALAAGAVVATSLIAVPTMASAEPTCATAWNATQAYGGGSTVSLNGANFTANWWTLGDNPTTHSGGAGSGQPWTLASTCTSGSSGSGSGSGSGAGTPTATPSPSSSASTTTPTAIPTPTTSPSSSPSGSAGPCANAWSASTAYSGGQQATSGGNIYRANWWTQGDQPETHSGPSGSGKPWTLVSSCAGGGSSTVTPTPTATPKPASTTTPGTGGLGSGPFFSPYKDATINMNWNTHTMRSAASGTMQPLLGAGSLAQTAGMQGVTLAFATGACGNENWGGVPGPAFASANVPELVASGVNYIVSTGGAAGAFTCDSPEAMKTFIDRYASPNLVGIDFDIEAGQTPAQLTSLINAAAGAQKSYPKLRFSFTLATLAASDGSFGGLNGTGDAVVKAVKAASTAGLTNYTINLMTMDYGAANRVNCVVANGSCDMGASAVQAAVNFQHTYGIPFERIELTPMVGVNDVSDEVFTLADVDTVVSFAKTQHLAGVHFWSLDRDTPCAVAQTTASPICNSVTGSVPLAYTTKFQSALSAP